MSAASVSMIANYVFLCVCYSASTQRQCKVPVTWLIMVSILIVHYYHIIILGGEILISACHCVEVVPVNMTLGLFCRDVQVAGCKKIKGKPSPQVPLTSFYIRSLYIKWNVMSGQTHTHVLISHMYAAAYTHTQTNTNNRGARTRHVLILHFFGGNGQRSHFQTANTS